MGVPLSHPFFRRMFLYKPSNLDIPVMETPKFQLMNNNLIGLFIYQVNHPMLGLGLTHHLTQVRLHEACSARTNANVQFPCRWGRKNSAKNCLNTSIQRNLVIRFNPSQQTDKHSNFIIPNIFLHGNHKTWYDWRNWIWFECKRKQLLDWFISKCQKKTQKNETFKPVAANQLWGCVVGTRFSNCSPPARWGLLDFMSTPAPSPSPPPPRPPRRTSTTMITPECSLPDLNHDHPLTLQN